MLCGDKITGLRENDKGHNVVAQEVPKRSTDDKDIFDETGPGGLTSRNPLIMETDALNVIFISSLFISQKVKLTRYCVSRQLSVTFIYLNMAFVNTLCCTNKYLFSPGRQ